MPRRVAWGDVISAVAARNLEWNENPDVEELIRYNLDGLRATCAHPRRTKHVSHDDSTIYWQCKDCGLAAHDPTSYPSEPGELSQRGWFWTASEARP